MRGPEKKDGYRAVMALRRADEALDGGRELFSSSETCRVIRFIGPTVVPTIRRWFKASPAQMVESNWIGDRSTIKPVGLASPVLFLKPWLLIKKVRSRGSTNFDSQVDEVDI